MEGFDPLCACVCAVIARRKEFGTTKGNLILKDGVVTNENLNWFGVGIEVKLGIMQRFCQRNLSHLCKGWVERTSDPAAAGSSRSAWLKMSP